MTNPEKQKLGKYQQAWIDALRAHPERKMTAQLGQGTPRNYKACCLGECLLTVARIKGWKFPFVKKNIMDQGFSGSLSDETVEIMGLYDGDGEIRGAFDDKHYSLVDANDSGKTWPEIADFIEANPKKIFSKEA